MADSPIKTIGTVTALIPEASTADEASEMLDGQSGDTDFPYAKFKALATVGEIDPVTKKALTGYPVTFRKDFAVWRLFRPLVEIVTPPWLLCHLAVH